MRAIACAGLCLGMLAARANALSAQDAGSKWAKRRAQYPELVSAYDLAEGAPAPLKAFALLQIATAPALKDRDWKKELLDEAFPAAVQSPIPWPATYVWTPETSVPADNSPKRIELSVRMGAGLNRLMLETRIVEAMLGIDTAQSISMFNQIGPLRLPVLTCADGIIPNVALYYQTATAVAQNGFTATEKQRGDPTEFLRGLVTSISSPVEINPVAIMLSTRGLPVATAPLISDFARKLETLGEDDRAFFADLDGTSETVMNLADSANDSLNIAVLKAWRNHSITNLKDGRCTETLNEKWKYSKSAAEAVAAFNSRVVGHESVAPIEKEDVFPVRRDPGSADDSPFPMSVAEAELNKRWRLLGFTQARGGPTDEQKADPGWIASFEEYLDDVADLKPASDESEADVWRYKDGLMHIAVMIAPLGPVRERAIPQYLRMLELNTVTSEMASDWYIEVESFVFMSNMLTPDHGEVTKELETSHVPLLMLMAKLERLKRAAESAARIKN